MYHYFNTWGEARRFVESQPEGSGANIVGWPVNSSHNIPYIVFVPERQQRQQ